MEVIHSKANHIVQSGNRNIFKTPKEENRLRIYPVDSHLAARGYVAIRNVEQSSHITLKVQNVNILSCVFA